MKNKKNCLLYGKLDDNGIDNYLKINNLREFLTIKINIHSLSSSIYSAVLE